MTDTSLTYHEFDDCLWIRCTNRGSFVNSPALKTISEIYLARGGKLMRHLDQKALRTILEGMYMPQRKGIGKIFNRDHTTALASYETIEKRIKTDAILTLDIGEMTKEVTGEAE